MTFRSAAGVIVVLAATAALAQNGQPGTTPVAPMLNQSAPIPNRQSLAERRGSVGNRKADPQSLAVMRERVQDMESTISQMRGVLKEMHARAAKNKPTDSLAKANLDMWELMVGHLDKDLQQLRETLAAREDLEARRADLYRQADAKAAAAAQAGRAAQAARFSQPDKNATGTPTPASSGQSTERSPVVQTAPAQPSVAPATNKAASPN